MKKKVLFLKNFEIRNFTKNPYLFTSWCNVSTDKYRWSFTFEFVQWAKSFRLKSNLIEKLYLPYKCYDLNPKHFTFSVANSDPQFEPRRLEKQFPYDLFLQYGKYCQACKRFKLPSACNLSKEEPLTALPASGRYC